MQPRPQSPYPYAIWFQSSPAPKSRCNRGQKAPDEQVMFQSSPAPKSRCNATGSYHPAEAEAVSILTGSEEPVQRDHDLCLFTSDGVSILTGSEEPVQPGSVFSDVLTSEFQSSPAPKSRCNAGKKRNACAYPCFNPHRLRRAGATIFTIV